MAEQASNIKVKLYEYKEETGSCLADMEVAGTGIAVTGFIVKKGLGNGVLVHMPGWMHSRWPYPDVPWVPVRLAIADRYRSLYMQETKGMRPGLAGAMKAAVSEPEEKTPVIAVTEKDLDVQEAAPEIRLLGEEEGEERKTTFCFFPHTVLRKRDYILQQSEMRASLQMGEEKAGADEKKNTQEAGKRRPAGAHGGFFKGKEEKETPGREQRGFYREAGTQRKSFTKEGKDEYTPRRNNPYDVLQGLLSGRIGQFEIGVLEWVSSLRYLNRMMIVNLQKGGFIKGNFSPEDITVRIGRMSEYELIEVSQFVTIDDEERIIPGTGSTTQIYTLGRQGRNLLKELGKEYQYDPFTTYQDGNTVKRYLAANQWLIYWLCSFYESIGNRYDTAYVVSQKGASFMAARLYASVTCGDTTLVCEPVRRVEDFEVESNSSWLRDKCVRLIQVFDHMDELYNRQEEISFPSRPVIVYTCEDLNHIREVFKDISDIAKANPQQEFWFTSDRRIFDPAMKDKRFLTFVGDQIAIVDLEKQVGAKEK